MLILLLCMLCSVTYAKMSKTDSMAVRVTTIEQRILADEQEIACVEKEVVLCEKEMSAVNEHVDRVNEAIANQIAASSHTIQVWGIVIAVIAIVVSIVLTIAGIFFTHYINKMRKNIIQLTSEAKKQLKQAEAASDEIADQQQRLSAQQQEIMTIHDATEKNVKELQQLYADIQNDMQAIYTKLRREETKAILAQLEKVPEDMFNVEDILLARTLEEDDFPHMLNAYHTLMSQRMDLRGITSVADLRVEDVKFFSLEGSYALQFAQHFMDKAIVDSELRVIVLADIDDFYKKNFFRNDAIKSTEGYKRGVSMLDENLQKELIGKCVSAIIGSPYEKMEELYTTLLTGLNEQQLSDIWDNVTKDNKEAFSFAKSIKEVVVILNPQSPLLEKIAAYLEKEHESKQN